jgi:hypothetical protein
LSSPSATSASARARPSPAGQQSARSGFICVALAAALLPSAGCSDQKINDFVVKIFEPKRTPQQHMLAAFAAEDPDLRRDSLAKVAQSKEFDRDWAIRGYVAIALLDTDTQARCVALRALARVPDPRAVDTALKLLNYRQYPPQEVRPPDALCRWDATVVLVEQSAAGRVPPERAEEVRAALCDRLRLDSDRHVRAAAARGLAYYPTPQTVEALVAGLNDESFAVVYECEESLVRLTGCTHHCDALAWEEWVAANRENLFAQAGNIPPSRRPPYRNRLEKVGYDVNQFVRWLVPAGKE